MPFCEDSLFHKRFNHARPAAVSTNRLAHGNSKYVFQLSMVGPHGGGNGARVSKRFTLPGRNAQKREFPLQNTWDSYKGLETIPIDNQG